MIDTRGISLVMLNNKAVLYFNCACIQNKVKVACAHGENSTQSASSNSLARVLVSLPEEKFNPWLPI